MSAQEGKFHRRCVFPPCCTHTAIELWWDNLYDLRDIRKCLNFNVVKSTTTTSSATSSTSRTLIFSVQPVEITMKIDYRTIMTINRMCSSVCQMLHCRSQSTQSSERRECSRIIFGFYRWEIGRRAALLVCDEESIDFHRFPFIEHRRLLLNENRKLHFLTSLSSSRLPGVIMSLFSLPIIAHTFPIRLIENGWSVIWPGPGLTFAACLLFPRELSSSCEHPHRRANSSLNVN